MSDMILLALTNPVSGRDADSNAWYDDVHLADVLRVPGITWAQRFAVAAGQGALPLNYLAIYGVADDAAVTQGLGARRGTPLMSMTDALDGDVTRTVMAKPAGPRLVAPQAPPAPAHGFDLFVAIFNEVPAHDAGFDAVLATALPAMLATKGVAAVQAWTLAAHQTKPTVVDKRVVVCELYDRATAKAGLEGIVPTLRRPVDIAAFYTPRGPRHPAE